MDGGDVYPTGADGAEKKPLIRARRPDDMADCVRVLAAVHATDGYPMRWPADPPGWLTPERLLVAWVAEDAGAIVGHVALCGATGDSGAPLWSAASGLPAERLIVVARLFIAPAVRGRGLGAALLSQACAEAHRRGLRPVLEVLDHDRGAVALYERAGWRCVASAPASWAPTGGEQLSLRYYVALEW
ncbi:MAG TPA: GNAT family N-acetyltransferase [Ktedonobacterales bacterium]|nr:GNAT family N-acetyltransferase [Ktedonobacterales bacterium]